VDAFQLDTWSPGRGSDVWIRSSHLGLTGETRSGDSVAVGSLNGAVHLSLKAAPDESPVTGLNTLVTSLHHSFPAGRHPYSPQKDCTWSGQVGLTPCSGPRKIISSQPQVKALWLGRIHTSLPRPGDQVSSWKASTIVRDLSYKHLEAFTQYNKVYNIYHIRVFAVGI